MFNLVITLLITVISLLLANIFIPFEDRELKAAFIFVLGTFLLGIPTTISRICIENNYKYKELLTIRFPGFLFLYSLLMFLSIASDIRTGAMIFLCMGLTLMMIPQVIHKEYNEVGFMEAPIPGTWTNVYTYIAVILIAVGMYQQSNNNEVITLIAFGISFFGLIIRDIIVDQITKRNK